MNEAIIKLAEAMGWKPSHETHEQVWIGPDTKAGDFGNYFNYDQLPNPFTDAGDDHAVLEFMRPENFRESKPIMGPEHERWRDFIFELRLIQLKENRESSAIQEGYMLGDNARAACSVLDITLEAV